MWPYPTPRSQLRDTVHLHDPSITRLRLQRRAQACPNSASKARLQHLLRLVYRNLRPLDLLLQAAICRWVGHTTGT